MRHSGEPPVWSMLCQLARRNRHFRHLLACHWVIMMQKEIGIPAKHHPFACFHAIGDQIDGLVRCVLAYPVPKKCERQRVGSCNQHTRKSATLSISSLQHSRCHWPDAYCPCRIYDLAVGGLASPRRPFLNRAERAWAISRMLCGGTPNTRRNARRIRSGLPKPT